MSAVTINLLPDIRLAKIKAKKNRQLVTGISSLVVASSLGITAVIFLITLGQQAKLSNLQSQIIQKEGEINATPNLEKLLTTQEHLASLPELYRQRIYLSKFVNLLSGVAPKDMAVTKMSIDPKNTIKITAQTRNFGSATKFAKALEASKSTRAIAGKEGLNANFTDTQLETLSAEKDGRVNFTLTTTASLGATNGQ